jgi:hypothetical protein
MHKLPYRPTLRASDPALPDGLALDRSSGTITGTGTAYVPPRDYAVVATYATLPNDTNVVTVLTTGGSKLSRLIQ